MAITGSKLGCALVAAGAVGVVVLVAVSIAQSVVSTAPQAGASASASVLDIVSQAPADAALLLDSLRPGEKLGDFTVYRISTPAAEHRVRIELHQASLGFSVWIEKKKPGLAPRQTDKYSIFYGETWAHGDATLPAGYQEAVLDAVVARLKKSEANTPAPEGL